MYTELTFADFAHVIDETGPLLGVARRTEVDALSRVEDDEVRAFDAARAPDDGYLRVRRVLHGCGRGPA